MFIAIAILFIICGILLLLKCYMTGIFPRNILTATIPL